MAWRIGLDEAGYGPNLGPFVMSAVACRVPDDRLNTDLWELLRDGVRRQSETDDGRVAVDDSKAVYDPVRGLAPLETAVLAALGGPPPATLADLVERLCPGLRLSGECWYTGTSPLPGAAAVGAIATASERLVRTAKAAGVGLVHWRSRVVSTPEFNAITDAHGTKGAVLALALGELLRAILMLANDGPLTVAVDKHGGRNTYAAMLQDALTDGVVVARREGPLRSEYEVLGLGRPVTLTFQPRADQEHFPVALASMMSKYVRELLMGEFNAYWCREVPGLKPTAGYPVDAARFLRAIRPAVERLGLAEEAVWRRK